MGSIIDEATSNAVSRLGATVTSEVAAISGRLTQAAKDNPSVNQAVNDLDRLSATVSTQVSNLTGGGTQPPAGTPSSAASSSTDTASTKTGFEHPI